MSLFNILKGGALGEVLQTLASQAGNTASNVTKATPGGIGGLVGAGVLGALLGRNLSGAAVQNAALLGAGAVAWNFYQKWAANKKAAAGSSDAQAKARATAEAAEAGPMQLDATSTLVIRAMVYAARADGNIDATERSRMHSIIGSMMPDQNVDKVIASFEQETIAPDVLAREVTTPEQGEDLYRLSCMVIDIDHFMERGYIDALGKNLGLDAARMAQLEQEANEAKASLNQARG